MTTGETVVFIVLLVLSIGALVLSIRHFMEKGYLFNNAYIWATKEERAKLDKKPHYRQSAIAFLLISCAFLMPALNLLTDRKIFLALEGCFIAAALVYAIVSSVKIEKQPKK